MPLHIPRPFKLLPQHLHCLLRVALTLLLALAAAQIMVALAAPIPWMLGPLLATALVSMAGLPTESSGALRNAGQWVIGAALGLYFTPDVATLVAGLWWAVGLAIVWTLLLGTGFGLWLQRVYGDHLPEKDKPSMRATTYFSGSVGAASEMTLLAERVGARSDLVAAAHSLRLVIVVLVVPFCMQAAQKTWGFSAMDMSALGAKTVAYPGLLGLALATGAGAWLMARLGRANPWFMGPLLVSMGLTLAGVAWSAMPAGFSNAAQLVIGVSLGVRFSAGFLRTAPRWLAVVGVGTLGLLALCACFGALLAWASGLHPATSILATAPGGIAEIAITAKVLQLGVPVVTAFQVCRVIAVLFLVEPIYHWLYRRS